jgi:TonB family protein
MKGLFILLFAFLVTSTSAQTSEPSTKTFDKDGLKFNYPLDWTITDNSATRKQHLLLSKKDVTVLIGIESRRDGIASIEQFRELESDTQTAYFKAVSDSLNTTYEQRVDRECLCLDLHGRNVIGMRMAGLYNSEPSKGEFYSFILGGRLVTLSYLRTDKDVVKTDPVWQELINSLSLEGSNKEAGVSFFEPGVINEGHINSRAAFLKRPVFPTEAGKAGASGLVLVQVEIDETGKRLSLKAISGPRLLYAAAESAVRQSKFKPTAGCGKPLRIKGTILFDFRR